MKQYTHQSDEQSVLTTPPIPDWIRDFRTPNYTNIYELCPDESRLYGTESLYGDWSAEVLLLAKDFAPRCLIDDRLADGDQRPFRHEPKMKTNRMLQCYAAPFGDRLLYGSALAGLLRNDGKVRGALPDRATVMPWAARVLDFTILSMPNLKSIACLGADAWDCTLRAIGISNQDWRTHRIDRRPLNVNGLQIHALAHPSTFPGGRDTVQGDWNAMHTSLAA